MHGRAPARVSPYIGKISGFLRCYWLQSTSSVRWQLLGPHRMTRTESILMTLCPTVKMRGLCHETAGIFLCSRIRANSWFPTLLLGLEWIRSLDRATFTRVQIDLRTVLFLELDSSSLSQESSDRNKVTIHFRHWEISSPNTSYVFDLSIKFRLK